MPAAVIVSLERLVGADTSDGYPVAFTPHVNILRLFPMKVDQIVLFHPHALVHEVHARIDTITEILQVSEIFDDVGVLFRADIGCYVRIEDVRTRVAIEGDNEVGHTLTVEYYTGSVNVNGIVP